eukprot:m.386223 g.386223  ORF g.386223 m.386223 type:complete len:65 (+) comp56297_c0_seq20:289-483(+)
MSASQEDPSERVAEVTALADEIKRLIRLPEQGIAGASEIVARASTLHQVRTSRTTLAPLSLFPA